MIVQVPAINGLGITNGCESAPKLICDSLNLESKSILVDNGNVDEQQEKIYSEAMRILKSNKSEKDKITFIGGDHSISFPLCKAFLENSENPGVLVFDAHPDLMEPMQNPTHEEWLRALVESKNFHDILVVGIRRNSENVDKREVDFAKENSIKLIYADEFDKRKEEVLSFCKGKQIYISFDIDVFDEALVDSTGFPESNGLGENLIDLMKKIKNVNVLDLVEVDPTKGDFEKTLSIVRRILWKK